MSNKNLPLKIMAFAIGGIFLTAALVFVGIQLKSRSWSAVPATLDYPPIQKVSEESRLLLAFPEKMDKTSMNENLEMPAGFKANGYWKDDVLVFEPEKKLETGKTYSFHVKRQALTASGKPINKSLEYKFTVAGPPVLSGHYPLADVTEIPVDSKITLVFDRPIIPLSAVQGSGAKKYSGDWPVTITPAVAGSWKWLGTSTVEFAPQGKLTSATTYKVSVPAGITDLIGDKTKDDFSWSFTTTRPQVVGTDPSDGYDKVGPTPDLSVTFNLPIDLSSAKQTVQLMKGAYTPPMAAVEYIPPEPVAASIAYGEEEVDGKKRVAENMLKITPQDTLELGTAHYLLIKAGLKGKEGDLGLETDYILNFSTVGEFKVESAEYLDRQISIKFTSPVEGEKLKGNVSIEPKVEGWGDLNFETYEWSDNRALNLYPDLKPSTEYTLTLSDKVEDKFGRKLKEPYTLKFTTNRKDPDVTVLSKGEFGIFETARPPLYPMQATNVSQLNIEFARVPFSEFLKIRQIKSKNWESQPDLSGYVNYKKITLPLKNTLNVTEVLNFDIEKETGVKLAPGIYALKTQAPEYISTYGNKAPIVDYQFFALTDIALTLKYSGNRALVWAVDMEKGAPVEGVEIKFHSLLGDSSVVGKTDKDGFFETDLDLSKFKTDQNEWMPEFWVTGTKDSNFSFVSSQWNEGLDAWNFGINEDFRSPSAPPTRLDSYVYTERQAYRPGDTVHYKALLRLRDKNGVFHLPKTSQKVMVTVSDSQGNEIYNKTFSPNAFGSLNDNFPVDAKAALGQYNLSLRMMPEDSVDYNWGGTGFYVLAYRKPEYKVEVTPEKEDYFGGDTLRFKVKGSYFFGAPMDGAK